MRVAVMDGAAVPFVCANHHLELMISNLKKNPPTNQSKGLCIIDALTWLQCSAFFENLHLETSLVHTSRIGKKSTQNAPGIEASVIPFSDSSVSKI